MNNTSSKVVQQLLRQVNTPWKMWFYYITKLPSVAFWGMRLQEATPDYAIVTMRYGWRNQNPFRSMYFAAECGAAEFSTGILGQIAKTGHPPISSLITHVEGKFTKKAVGKITFTCTDGAKAQAAVQHTLTTGEAKVVEMLSIATNEQGQEVARIRFHWSFKKRRSV